ncbi:hypothetical protein [Nocardia sp. NBC_01009]|uniref:hypothetical protein n=1 Tax=Nocardia sp. NBC_01009 TaxID=2975996 RepID=UPI00386D85C0|nr:hypothetical protein OHA42_18145 [Nocardia sp. NBC_01009]
MNDLPHVLASLRELVSHRYIVEILDALSNRPHTAAELTAITTGRHRALAQALRVAASHGLVTNDCRGSWDGAIPATDIIRLTDRGMRAVELLSNLSVWTALYEHTDHAHDR